jgi:hypothetical protein
MKKSLFLCASLLLSSTTALANPMMVVQELRGQAVAGPHVKLTYTYNYGSPVGITTHGTSHSPWADAGSTSRDTGSGVKSLPILQMCDCHVPTSTALDYSTTTSPSVTTQVQVPADPTGGDCMDPCQSADDAIADAGGRDVPVSTDGISSAGGAIAIGDTSSAGGAVAIVDASAAGGAIGAGGMSAAGGATPSGGRPAQGGAVGAGGLPAAGGDIPSGGSLAQGGAIGAGGIATTGGAPGSGTSDKSNGSGCAFVAPGSSPTLLCLAVLGLAIAARRRRP